MWWFLLLVAPARAGLFGSDAPARIPVPSAVFRATVEDIGGVAVELDRVTFDSEVFVFGTLGRAQVTVPFERVEQVVFEVGPDLEHRTAVVTVTDGPTVSVVVEADRPIWGRTVFGNYRIEVGDVRRLTVSR